MKKTLIIIMAMCLILLSGCTGGPAVPAEKLNIAPTGDQEVGNTPPEQTAEPSAELLPTPENGIRYCFFPDEYAKLEEFLFSFGFGAENFEGETILESGATQLKNGLWRSSFYSEPPKQAYVLLCETPDEDMLKAMNADIPGGDEHRVGRNGVNVRFIQRNPEYSSENDENVPTYLVDDESTLMAFIDEAPLLLNGYGMSRIAYPIASEGGTAYSLRKYIEYDYERIIPDVKKAGEPYSVYEIYYCENEIFWFEQLKDINEVFGIGNWAYRE